MDHRQRLGALRRRSRGSGHRAECLSSARDLAESATALYDSREPAKMLANLEGISIEAAFILKDLHRHMEDSIVVRRLRDVGQTFATNRRTVILTAPKISIPPELANLVEFLELPLPDRPRLRQIIERYSLGSPRPIPSNGGLLRQGSMPWRTTSEG